MKKIISLMIVIFILPINVYAKDILVEGIEVNKKSIYMQCYEEEQILCEVYPKNATNRNLLYKSMDTTIVKVDDNGNIYAKSDGNTKIKISSEDGGAEIYVNIYVEYENDDTDGENVPRYVYITYDNEVVKNDITLMESEKIKLGIKVSPSSASKDVYWRSSNEKIARVDDKGNVEAIGIGECKIYATSRYTSLKKDSVTLKVTEFIKFPDSIKIVPPKDANYITGNTVHFEVEFYPENTTERQLRWYAYGGAEIDYKGDALIKDSGSIRIKVYSQDYKQSAEYTFEAKYNDNHFTEYGNAYNLCKERKIEIYTNSAVDKNSAIQNIFATTTPDGNGEHIPIDIITDNDKITIIPQKGWNVGDNYLFIKENLKDINNYYLSKNLKYKINVRGAFGDEIN